MAKAMAMSSAVLLLLPLMSAASGMQCPKNYCLMRTNCESLASTTACPKGRYQPAEFQCVQTRTQGNACAVEGGTCMCPGGKVDFGNYGEPNGQNHGDGYWTATVVGEAGGTSCSKTKFTDYTNLPEPTKSSPRLGCRCHPAENPWAAVTTQDVKPARCAGNMTGYEKPTCIHVNFNVQNKESSLDVGMSDMGSLPVWREKGALNASEWLSTGADQLTYELTMMGALEILHKQTHPRKCNFYKPSTTSKATATEFQAYSSAITGAWIPNISYEPGIPAEEQPGSDYCMTRVGNKQCRTRRFLQQGANIIVPDAYEALKMWDEIVFQNTADSLPTLDKSDPKYQYTEDQLMPESCWTKAVKAYQQSTFAAENSCKYQSGGASIFCWTRANQDNRPSFMQGLLQGWKHWNGFFPVLTEESAGECPLATTGTTTVTTTTTSTTIVTKVQTTPRPGNTDTGKVGGSTMPPAPDVGKVASNARSSTWSLASASSLLLFLIRGASQ